MKKAKNFKALKLIICATLILSLLIGAISIVTAAETSRAVVARAKGYPYQNPTGESPVSANGPVGVRLNIIHDFTGVNFKLATFMKNDLQADISLYEWRGSYAKSIDGGAVFTQTITLKDNATQGVVFDREIPAGDYIFVFHNYTGAVAMYSYSSVEAFDGYIYQNGYPVTENISYPVMQVLFPAKKDTYFTSCSKPEDIIDGNHTTPPEYVIPSDSLIYTHAVMPDTWVFTDGLGRVSLTNAEVGDPKDRALAMFYWSWHIDSNVAGEPVNLQKLSEQYPDAMNDFDNPLWNSYLNSKFLWNESIYGFYKSDDTWVLRKQAELLANAGVDVIFTDNTNGQFTWANAYNPLMETWSDAMADGVMTPKVSFMLPFWNTENTNAQVKSIYLDIFRPGKYQELWFYWDSKPMLMGLKDSFNANASLVDKEIYNFFSFRAGEPEYIVKDTQNSSWGWLSMYPQALHYENNSDRNNNKVEQMAVGVAMNHNYNLSLLAPMNGKNISGRSYTSDYKNRYDIDGAEASKWGYNFAEQFNYALSVDPKVILVTGWNEYQAGRFEVWPDNSPTSTENAFPDQFNDEFSRDIEPSKGALQDHYYYQLVNFSRQYQGARPIPTPSENKSINLLGGIDQWSDVEPYYASYIGNTDDRAANGYGSLYYTETSGRNDIIGSQIARDDEYVYFLVECADNITPCTDSLWMNLYIDSDQQSQGWNTFEYVIGKSQGSETALVLEKFTTDDSYNSEKVADVEYNVDGRYMTVKIKKSDLGISGDDFTINFTWTDNVHDEGDYSKFSGDIMDFYISGDVAPGGRFKYSFISTTENSGNDTPDNPDNPGNSDETTDATGEETSTDAIEDTSDIQSTETDASSSDSDVTENITEEITEEITPDTTENDSNVTETDTEITGADTSNDSEGTSQNTQEPTDQSSGKKGCGSVVAASPITIIAVGAYLATRKRRRK